HEVLGAGGRGAKRDPQALDRRGIAPLAEGGETLALAGRDRLVDLEGGDLRLIALRLERVHPDDDPGLRLDLALVAVCRVLDRALLVPALDAGERSPELVDARELRERARFDVRGELLDEVRTAERVDR